MVHTWEEARPRSAPTWSSAIAHIEGANIEDNVLVSSTSVLLRRVRVGNWALVGAGALVPPGRWSRRCAGGGHPLRDQGGRPIGPPSEVQLSHYVDRVPMRGGLRRLG
ncbi:MAG: hypothetical protein R2749_21510 [Acidimicrobiales bacterium]